MRDIQMLALNRELDFAVLSESDKEFAYAFLSSREAYHTQKENSAYTVFLVEGGLFGGVLSSGAYETISKAFPSSGIVLVLAILFIWSLFHIFIRWQLKNRRLAAFQAAALIRALLDNLSDRSEQIEHNGFSGATKLEQVLDFLVPRPTATMKSDVELDAFPNWYKVRYLSVQKNGSGATFAEIFPTYGSIIVLIVSLAYVFARL